MLITTDDSSHKGKTSNSGTSTPSEKDGVSCENKAETAILEN